MTNILEIKNLYVEADGQELLHDVNLTIPDGEAHTGCTEEVEKVMKPWRGTLTGLKNETFWSKSADTYMNDTRYVAGEAVLQEVLDRLSAERDLGQVVEFGCGTGCFTKIIAPHAEQVVATDLSG